MGCSYDPVPMTIYPSPAELWMEDNHFREVRNVSGMNASICDECGALISGSRYGTKYLKLHVRVCPISPRGEVPEKTEAECKERPRTVYR